MTGILERRFQSMPVFFFLFKSFCPMEGNKATKMQGATECERIRKKRNIIKK